MNITILIKINEINENTNHIKYIFKLLHCDKSNFKFLIFFKERSFKIFRNFLYKT